MYMCTTIALVVGIIGAQLGIGFESRVKSSAIGSIRDTQGVIDLCAEKKIYPEIQTIPVEEINGVYQKLAATNASVYSLYIYIYIYHLKFACMYDV